MTVPTIINHLSLGTNDFEKATAFYDKVLGVLGATRITEHPGVVAYGRAFPEFWVHAPYDGKPATVGNGAHVAFFATSKAQVDAFHEAALQVGGVCDGKPGGRPEYGTPYYGCFVRDPDGHKVEATFWDAPPPNA